MARALANLFGGIVLRNAASAVTTTASETAVTDAELSQFSKGAIAVVLVSVADDADANETYVLTIEGRDVAGSGTYVVLATLTITRGTVGQTGYLLSIDQVRNDMRVTMTTGGTTPSIEYQCILIAPATYRSNALILE